MKKKHYLLSLSLAILFAWFLATIFIDFFAVPNVFRTVSSRDEAASLGVIIFSKFNAIELICGLVIFILSIYLWTKNLVKNKTYLIPCVILIIFPLVYTFNFSPNIKHYNELKIENGETPEIQSKLDFYHHLYVKTDSAKLLVLLYTIVYANVLMLKREEV